MSRRDYNYANYCLEKWVLWNTEHNGFPSRSPILKFGENPAHIAASSIPTGVEPNNREVEYANFVLAVMNGGDGKSPQRAHILKVVVINRSNGETIKELIKRLDMGISERQYYDALEEFAMRLDTVLNVRKIA